MRLCLWLCARTREEREVIACVVLVVAVPLPWPRTCARASASLKCASSAAELASSPDLGMRDSRS